MSHSLPLHRRGNKEFVGGLGWVGFHTFRHTCASLLFGAGKNAKQAQRWLGHHKASFTLDTYVHLMDEGVGDADFLDGAVSTPTPQLVSSNEVGADG
jgi:integrase